MIMNGREKSIRQHKKMYKVIKKMICSVHLNENMPIFFAGTNKVHTNPPTNEKLGRYCQAAAVADGWLQTQLKDAYPFSWVGFILVCDQTHAGSALQTVPLLDSNQC